MKVEWDKITDAEYFLAAMSVVHECDNCLKCCTNMDGIAYCVLDADRMAKHLNISRTTWIREMTVPSTRQKGDRWLKLVGPEKKCPYLTDKGCSQYPGRGQVCRNYPWASSEQMLAAKSGQIFRVYQKCTGMVKTYIKYLEASFGMNTETAQSILNSHLKKIAYLRYIDNEGRGEAARYAAKDLGLADIPEEDSIKGIAQAYVIATLCKVPETARHEILAELYNTLEAQLNG